MEKIEKLSNKNRNRKSSWTTPFWPNQKLPCSCKRYALRGMNASTIRWSGWPLGWGLRRRRLLLCPCSKGPSMSIRWWSDRIVRRCSDSEHRRSLLRLSDSCRTDRPPLRLFCLIRMQLLSNCRCLDHNVQRNWISHKMGYSKAGPVRQ